MNRSRMHTTPGTLAVALTAALVISRATLPAHDLIYTKVTWTHDISRLVQARCVNCHVPGGRSGGISLTTYEEARPWARAIREQVLMRKMPIWHAARGYGDFANDPSLSPFEIALIAAWVDGGAPKGTDADKRLGTGDRGEGTRVKGEGTRDKSEGIPEKGKPGMPGTKPTGPEARNVTVPCESRPLTGRLLAVTPTLAKGGSVGIAALLPDGRREVVAWIRNYDPDYPTTYWLRTPLELPRGSRLMVEPSDSCRLTVTLNR
jgi:hypothetical protein